VVDFALTPEAPLGGLHHESDGVRIDEITDRAIVSVAVPLEGRDRLNDALVSAFGAGLPQIGTSTRSDGRTIHGLQSDLAFVVFDYPDDRPDRVVGDAIADAGTVTDQSDAWAILQVSGPRARTALERICPLDLHADVFADGAVARTVMEHLGVIIHRNGPDSFLMLSARSSAESFAEAVMQSVENTG
jgi:sarcosine oxidase subunit gamma